MSATADPEQEQAAVAAYSHSSTFDDYRSLEGLHLGLALLDNFDPSAEVFVPLGEDLLNRFLRGSPSPVLTALRQEEEEKEKKERRSVGPELFERMKNNKLPWVAKLKVLFCKRRSERSERPSPPGPEKFITVGARAAHRLKLLKAIRVASAITVDGEVKEIKYWGSAHVWAVFQVAPVAALEKLLRKVRTGRVKRESLELMLREIYWNVQFLIHICNAVNPPKPTASAATGGKLVPTRAEEQQLGVLCDSLASCIPVWGREMVDGFADAIGKPEWIPLKLRYVTAIMAVLVVGTAPHELYIADPWELEEPESEEESRPDAADSKISENDAERDGPVIEGLRQIREQDSENRWNEGEPPRETQRRRYR
ncbi:hypothetical protein CPLU01_07898 [Colletotrichum plurivorum]|uniref:Uncharacterized protein n=1 Tax=Colletotrichum plurivorum TaxID=2175906 RepID=A0A8H6KDK9_9PEZI|nr:hypothetical protein CPLU01_07898 [Colletotrichum plurivorum]